MYKLDVTLKQHTPLIHFQHDQDGATLRASEVKPKLDKFILTKLGKNPIPEYVILGRNEADKEKKQYDLLNDHEKGRCIAKGKGWLIGKGEHPALDYKITISIMDYATKLVFLKETQKTIRDNETKYFLKYYNEILKKFEDFPCLLANMGGKEQKQDLVNLVMYDKIKMVFKSGKNDILNDLIKETAPVFFANTNFGQRSTKGFGSFSVIQIENNEILWDQEYKNYFPNKTQLMKFSLEGAHNKLDGQYRLFKTIDFYWKVLKSGVNFSIRKIGGENQISIAYPDRYIKSFLWKYLNDKGINWEKRSIKTHFSLETSFPRRPIVASTNNPIFARALLGCPDKYEYRIPLGITYFDHRNNRLKENIDTHLVTVLHDEPDKEKKIDRIASPITFKPVISGNIVSVYILIDSSICHELAKQSTLQYNFTCTTNPNPLLLHIDNKCIDYNELITQYHCYLWKDPEVSKKIFSGSDVKETDRRFKMIPRDYYWENILGNKPDTGSNIVVSFFQIINHNNI